MNVVYPPEYPDVYPDVSLEAHEDADEDLELTSEETDKLLSGLEEVVGLAEMAHYHLLICTGKREYGNGNDVYSH